MKSPKDLICYPKPHLRPEIEVGLPLAFKRKFDPLTPFSMS